MTIGGTFSTTIQAPIDHVWAVVSDVGTHASWSPKPYEFDWTRGEPNQVGSTFHSVGSIPGAKHNENEVEITERVEPTRFAFRSNDPQGVFLNAYDLKPVSDGAATEVSYTITFPKLNGMAAMVAPILFPLSGKPDIRKRLEMLKQRVEGAT